MHSHSNLCLKPPRHTFNNTDKKKQNTPKSGLAVIPKEANNDVRVQSDWKNGWTYEPVRPMNLIKINVVRLQPQ